MPKVQDIEFPQVALKHCTTEEYCLSLLECGELHFWWYGPPRRSRKIYSLPFRDNAGRWWYQAYPGFGWPVDFFDPISSAKLRLPFSRSYLGCQHIVPDGEPSNCALVINTILNLSEYGPHAINDKRRNAIRKGIRSCEVVVAQSIADEWISGATTAWNDLVSRTGWNAKLDEDALKRSWSRLLELPAATLLLALDRKSGDVAGFLITKVYGQTAYVDTIASNSALLRSNPNDALMYTFIRNAQRLPGVTRMHYAIRSNVESLENFKTSLGFVHHSFPAALHTPPGMMTLLRFLWPEKHRQLKGKSKP